MFETMITTRRGCVVCRHRLNLRRSVFVGKVTKNPTVIDIAPKIPQVDTKTLLKVNHY